MTTNPYGFMNLWEQGDWVTRSVALILMTMSVLSWYVIVLKSLQLKRFGKQAEIAGGMFWQAKNLHEGLQLLGGNLMNPFRALTEEGMTAASRHTHDIGKLNAAFNLKEWLDSCLRRSIENITQHLQSGLPLLASVGSTSPFIGLFGTVWGIYHALVGIGVSGQASIDQVSGPVGEALVMTAFGLAVAIPAVLGYNALVNGNKKMLSRLRNFAHDLQVCLISEEHAIRPMNTVGEIA